MKKINLAAITAGLIMGVSFCGLTVQTATATPNRPVTTVPSDGPSQSRLAKQVRHKLLMLPYYGVFDNLAYSIDGSRVTLHGQVVRPSTRTDAARSVAGIEGVSQVVNKIEVLPPSGFDDSIRTRTYRALARTGGLYRYFMGSNPSLHIVVNRGQVTLTGVVGSKLDKQLAYMTARQVSGAFSVTNDLQVEGEGEAR
ncbi:MAG: transport-associated protein [Acidobacteria bacterium]|nr:transport-associated protein [Acidobacteriota bacterium]